MRRREQLTLLDGIGSKNNTFKTIMGDIKFEDQVSHKFWTVGQWQGGEFYGVASSRMPNAKPVILKEGWK